MLIPFSKGLIFATLSYGSFYSLLSLSVPSWQYCVHVYFTIVPYLSSYIRTALFACFYWFLSLEVTPWQYCMHDTLFCFLSLAASSGQYWYIHLELFSNRSVMEHCRVFHWPLSLSALLPFSICMANPIGSFHCTSILAPLCFTVLFSDSFI